MLFFLTLFPARDVGLAVQSMPLKGRHLLSFLRSPEHMKEDLEAAKMILTETEMSDIGSIFSGRFF